MTLLAIDIGNTNVTAGIFSKERLVRKFSVPTGRCRSFIRALNKTPEAAIISSVVPQATEAVRKELQGLSVKTLVVGKDIQAPIRNLYRKPRQVGQDRLVNAVAGVSLYGAPLIVVDFGTAVTFDVVSRKGDYIGGMILPGLEISLDGLYDRTALLPRVKLSRPKELIGRDTASSITSGIVYGFAAVTDDLCRRIRSEIGAQTPVIGTGGAIFHVAAHCRSFQAIEPNLTLIGLNFIFNSRNT